MLVSRGFLNGFLLFLSLLCVISASSAQVCVSDNSCSAELLEEDQDAHLEETLEALLSWIREKGGIFNPKLEIRAMAIDEDIDDLLFKFHLDQKKHAEESGETQPEKEHKPHLSEDGDEIEPTYQFGIFVRENEVIEEGEELLLIPESAMIISDVKSLAFEDDICLLADELAGERFAHEDGNSEFGPYVQFLEEYVVGEVFLPMSWSQSGKNILAHVVPDDFFEDVKEYQHCLKHEVDGQEIPHKEFQTFPLHYEESIEVALSRTRQNIKLVPLYDMVAHSNNINQINVAATFPKKDDEDDETLSLKATRKIESNEELKFSYGLGMAEQDQWQGVMQFGIGTAELFRDHGIIEDYPQRWFFPAHFIDFSIVAMDLEDGKTTFGIGWNSEVRPDDDAIYTLEQLYQRLFALKAGMDNWEFPEHQPAYVVGVNPREVKRTYDFLCNYIHVVELLLLENRERRGEDGTPYQLQEERVLIDNMDNLYFQVYQSNIMSKLKDTNFTQIESVRSAYQKIDYYKDPLTKDRCLYLDGVYQQCISYWPHYHELCVHKPAKYVKEGLKRVLWVGGGDSGVLNEFLKYPTLELAVGLELDQQVTRSAFKHFGSRPHYDDPRVQWWYGDASKSLLMLPEDYFGSFDLVIVDLSDTVFSLSVSAELDVIEAISLLLRPGGIFEMNELFMKKVSKVFEYAVHYQFNDVPRILDQAAIFASNDVDFMSQAPTEHKLVDDANLLVEKDSMLSEHQFHRVHDYRHNPYPAFKKLCTKLQGAVDKEPDDDKPQTTAPGIMMIVEAESLTADLSSPSNVRSFIVDAIKGVGLTVVSDNSSISSKSPWFVIMMKEGYAVVRLWSKEKYCALDIHLWSAFDSHDSLKEAIVVKALGGDIVHKSTSSYRIVAGGMFGLSNWKEEAKKHGPQLDNLCEEEKEPIRDQASPVEVYLEAMEMSLDIMQGSGLTAAVLCGSKETMCSTLNVVKVGDRFSKVIPLYDAEEKDSADLRQATLDLTKETIESDLPDEAIVDAIFFDFEATVLANDKINMLLHGEHTDLQKIFLTSTTDSVLDIWKRRALSTMRDQIVLEPVYRAQFLFNTTSSSLELSITASGDTMHMEHISEAVAAQQKKSSTSTVEIRNILGGNWREPLDPIYTTVNVTFSAVKEDYDHTDSTEQWSSQSPVAVQTLLQFSNMVDGTATLLKKNDLVAACKEVFGTRIGASMTVYDDFGGDGAICAGTWETGTAVVSWDGRYGVDLNIFSTLEKDELNAFESDIKARLTNLGGWLRDIQPRGYGRVVNFKDAKKPGVSSLFVDA
ncbi:unnamed protein product [Cylindrotheca closterium]|uniref:Uncharacterized protein n=1 Tax=Cylindrotheca closterium TaxID=2856 RepID=A0AAD2CDN6_9STRA|nr:unnamed protein product [Cylindrotheca closterium]